MCIQSHVLNMIRDLLALRVIGLRVVVPFITGNDIIRVICLMCVFVCMCLCLFCPPLIPDVPALFEMGVLAELHSVVYTSTLILIYFLIVTSKNFLSGVRFIPLNVPLNMLVRKPKGNLPTKNMIIACCYLVFLNFMVLEEFASLFVFLDKAMLDVYCLYMLSITISLSIFFISTGLDIGYSAVVILLNHRNMIQPCFSNFELTAFWIFCLLIKLSSDVHPNPGPSPIHRNFPFVIGI